MLPCCGLLVGTPVKEVQISAERCQVITRKPHQYRSYRKKVVQAFSQHGKFFKWYVFFFLLPHILHVIPCVQDGIPCFFEALSSDPKNTTFNRDLFHGGSCRRHGYLVFRPEIWTVMEKLINMTRNMTINTAIDIETTSKETCILFYVKFKLMNMFILHF